MKHETQATKESRTTFLGTQKAIDKARAEAAFGGDLAPVLASQITNLTVLGRRGVALVQFTAVLRIKVAQRSRAVSVGGNGHGVDVPVEGPERGL